MIRGKDYIGVGVGALIFDSQGRVFLALRGPKVQNEVGKWEIPGGAVEFGETLECAIIREAYEEYGIKIKVKELLGVADHILAEESQHWVAPTFICEIIEGTPKINEPDKCVKIGWYTLDEAEKLPLSEVTKKDIELIKQKQII